MSVGHYGKGPWGQGFTSQVSQLGWVLRRTLLDLAEESPGYDLSRRQMGDLPLSPPPLDTPFPDHSLGAGQICMVTPDPTPGFTSEA